MEPPDIALHVYSTSSRPPVDEDHRAKLARKTIASLLTVGRAVKIFHPPSELDQQLVKEGRFNKLFSFEASRPASIDLEQVKVWLYLDSKATSPSHAESRKGESFEHFSTFSVASTSSSTSVAVLEEEKEEVEGSLMRGVVPALEVDQKKGKKKARFKESESPVEKKKKLRSALEGAQFLEVRQNEGRKRSLRSDKGVTSTGGSQEPRSVREDEPEGAIQRCIPLPYHHISSFPYRDPPRIHLVEIRHSFLDPPSPSPHPSTSKPTYPLASSTLTRGRRGAWIIPISKPFPIPFASQPLWLSLGNSLSLGTDLLRKGEGKPINWTDKRLRELWKFLTEIHNSGNMGVVDACCVFGQEGGGGERKFGDHIRVRADSHLALALRALLTRTKVDGEVGDQERFLERPKLVWVDETGKPVLLA